MSEAIKSLLRHFLTGLAAVLVTTFGFAEEEALGLTEALVIFAAGLITWVLAKWGPGHAKRIIKAPGPKLFLFLPCALALLFMGCATEDGSAVPGWYKDALPSDPEARFGWLISPKPLETPPTVK